MLISARVLLANIGHLSDDQATRQMGVGLPYSNCYHWFSTRLVLRGTNCDCVRNIRKRSLILLTAYGRACFDCTRKAWTTTDKRTHGSVRRKVLRLGLRLTTLQLGSSCSIAMKETLLSLKAQECSVQLRKLRRVRRRSLENSGTGVVS